MKNILSYFSITKHNGWLIADAFTWQKITFLAKYSSQIRKKLPSEKMWLSLMLFVRWFFASDIFIPLQKDMNYYYQNDLHLQNKCFIFHTSKSCEKRKKEKLFSATIYFKVQFFCLFTWCRYVRFGNTKDAIIQYFLEKN